MPLPVTPPAANALARSAIGNAAATVAPQRGLATASAVAPLISIFVKETAGNAIASIPGPYIVHGGITVSAVIGAATASNAITLASVTVTPLTFRSTAAFPAPSINKTSSARTIVAPPLSAIAYGPEIVSESVTVIPDTAVGVASAVAPALPTSFITVFAVVGRATARITSPLVIQTTDTGGGVIVISPPDTPTTGPRPGLLTIVHMDHYGNVLGEAEAKNRTVQLQLNKPEAVQYDMAFSYYLANKSYCEPDVTDFLVYYKGKPICGGMHTEVEVDNVETNMLRVAGQGWLHYFENRFWPPIDYFANPVDPYEALDKDIVFIAQDLIGYTSTWEVPKSIDIFFSNAACGQTIDYSTQDPFDSESIFSKVEGLSKIYPGFDFEITWDRVFKTYAPQKGTSRTYAFEQGKNCGALSYRNPGNGGNFFVGTGTEADVSIQSYVTYNEFRRKDATQDFGEVQTQENLDTYSLSEAARQHLPLKQMSLVWMGDSYIANIFDEVWLGDYVRVRGNTGYEFIDSYLRVVGIEINPTDEGDERVTFTFDDGSLSL